jgi:hypothetical protein
MGEVEMGAGGGVGRGGGGVSRWVGGWLATGWFVGVVWWVATNG